MRNFLLASTFGFGLIAFLVAKHPNFVTVGETLDRFGLESVESVAWVTLHRWWRVGEEFAASLTVVVVALAVDLRVRVDAALSVVLGEHHQPLVLLLIVLFLVYARLFLRDVGMLDGAWIIKVNR